MIYEMRTYQVHAGKASEFLKIYERERTEHNYPLRQARRLLDQNRDLELRRLSVGI